MMRQPVIIIAFALAGFITNQTIAQTPAEAKTYMDNVQAVYIGAQKDMWRYMSNVARDMSAKAVEQNRKDLLKTLNQSIRRVYDLEVNPAFYNLRDSTLYFLNASKEALEQDYGQLPAMESDSLRISDKMQMYLDALLAANQKIHEAYEQLENTRKTFAKQYEVIMLERPDEYAEKLKTTGTALDYYKDLCIILFESYKHEADMLQAIKEGDAAAAEESRILLLNNSREGLPQGQKYERFEDSDASLKYSLSRLLDFYRDEAENIAPYLIEFVQQNDTIEQEVYEARKPADRTNEEIEVRNRKVTAHNERVDKYNRFINGLGERRQRLIDNWNRDVRQFLNRHIPNY